jgi:HAD superfamily hydrolase (TIGR01490 family)
MEKLAIFDVDFTITSKETLIEFYRFIVGKHPGKISRLPQAAASGLFYKLRIHDEKAAKEMFLKYLTSFSEAEICMLSKEFYEKVLLNLLYRDGLNKIKELKAKGCRVILNSASPEFYLDHLYGIEGVDKVIGTKFLFENGKFPSKMVGFNNKGEEKVRRLYEYLDGEEIDLEGSYMFSDSMSDEPLLKLVGRPYLINYKRKDPKYPVLNWR